jgi:hypothetical protein
MLKAGYANETRTKVIFNQKGLDIIKADPALKESIIQYINTPINAEDIFKSYPRVGSGNNSIVHSSEGVAIKISTGSTGYLAYKHNTYIAPENLLVQSQFLNLLDERLTMVDEETIAVPEQYLALKTAHGNFLSLHENLFSLESLFDWIIKNQLTYEEELELNTAIKSDLNRKLGFTSLRYGLNDLGIRKNDRLRAKNIMIPLNSSDPLTAKKTIIDQPSRGVTNLIGGIVDNTIFQMRKNTFASLEELFDS